MAITKTDMVLIANEIYKAIKEEFAEKHMSMNLVDTIKIEMDDKGIYIDIPAPTYNMKMYQQKGVVVHTSHGSYASKLDEIGSEFYIYPNDGRTGSFLVKPHNHKDFINKAVTKAMENLSNILNNKYNVGKVEDY